MSAQSINFNDLSAATEVKQEEPSTKRGMEVQIEVAGPKEVEAKTVQLKLDQRGLIQLSFKEGGELPALLQGRFTSLTDVQQVLLLWQNNCAKEFKLDDKIQHPHSTGNEKNIEDLTKGNKSAPSFPKAKKSKGVDVVSLDDTEE
jgi:hypothetical protein